MILSTLSVLEIASMSNMILAWLLLSSTASMIHEVGGSFSDAYQEYGCVSAGDPLIHPGTLCKAKTLPPGFRLSDDAGTEKHFTHEQAWDDLKSSTKSGDCSGCAKLASNAVCSTWAYSVEYQLEPTVDVKQTAKFEWVGWYTPAQVAKDGHFSMCRGTCSGADKAVC